MKEKAKELTKAYEELHEEAKHSFLLSFPKSKRYSRNSTEKLPLNLLIKLSIKQNLLLSEPKLTNLHTAFT